jgi:hypothetical protein
MPTHLISHEQMEAIGRDLRAARKCNASMKALAQLMRTKYGLGVGPKEVWTLMGMLSDNENFSERDPGRGKKPPRPRKKVGWYSYGWRRLKDGEFD